MEAVEAGEAVEVAEPWVAVRAMAVQQVAAREVAEAAAPPMQEAEAAAGARRCL